MQDMTMSDPLIRQMLRADKVSLGATDRGRKLTVTSWAAHRESPNPSGQEHQSVA